ncbi:leucine-rich repeat extensin-like protein 5 isoform X1 [Chelonus insularis]|uniref:leucine-rich repeat extensin-like protein 5 isoform X1 n=1 Tax=Chelonus insularis TaxID=460826 RepID=UPI00158CE28C|nr:leucine-rich repeat extensin-like protein 5 isoform X1 [Chelonus insularis]
MELHDVDRILTPTEELYLEFYDTFLEENKHVRIYTPYFENSAFCPLQDPLIPPFLSTFISIPMIQFKFGFTRKSTDSKVIKRKINSESKMKKRTYTTRNAESILDPPISVSSSSNEVQNATSSSSTRAFAVPSSTRFPRQPPSYNEAQSSTLPAPTVTPASYSEALFRQPPSYNEAQSSTLPGPTMVSTSYSEALFRQPPSYNEAQSSTLPGPTMVSTSYSEALFRQPPSYNETQDSILPGPTMVATSYSALSGHPPINYNSHAVACTCPGPCENFAYPSYTTASGASTYSRPFSSQSPTDCSCDVRCTCSPNPEWCPYPPYISPTTGAAISQPPPSYPSGPEPYSYPETFGYHSYPSYNTAPTRTSTHCDLNEAACTCPPDYYSYPPQSTATAEASATCSVPYPTPPQINYDIPPPPPYPETSQNYSYPSYTSTITNTSASSSSVSYPTPPPSIDNTHDAEASTSYPRISGNRSYPSYTTMTSMTPASASGSIPTSSKDYHTSDEMAATSDSENSTSPYPSYNAE